MSTVTRTQKLTIGWTAAAAAAALLICAALFNTTTVAGTAVAAETTTDYPVEQADTDDTPDSRFLDFVTPKLPYATDTELLTAGYQVCDVLDQSYAPNEDTLVGIDLGLTEIYGWTYESAAAVIVAAIGEFCPRYLYTIPVN